MSTGDAFEDENIALLDILFEDELVSIDYSSCTLEMFNETPLEKESGTILIESLFTYCFGKYIYVQRYPTNYLPFNQNCSCNASTF
jgi:hypothetical protein